MYLSCADSLQGVVLEASPLPKLPVTGFDRLNRPGQQFLAFLGRQSLEEEKINGADPRIKYLGDHGAFPRFPFVLLLDGVVSRSRQQESQ